MVERPIKKAELEARKAAGEDSKAAPIKAKDRDRDDSRSSRDKGRGKGKGKGKGKGREEKAAPINPALVRGPRFAPKPAVEEPSEEEVPETPEAAEADTEVAGSDAASEPVAEGTEA